MPARIDILAVGKLDADFRPAFEHYRKLLGGFVTLTVREVRETSLRGRSPGEVLRDEGRRLRAALPRQGPIVVLDERGCCCCDSPALAARLQEWLQRGTVTFVIGGSLGLAATVVEAADERLSLSTLTLPHQLARVVLTEQLFRGLKIARGETYHH